MKWHSTEDAVTLQSSPGLSSKRCGGGSRDKNTPQWLEIQMEPSSCCSRLMKRLQHGGESTWVHASIMPHIMPWHADVWSFFSMWHTFGPLDKKRAMAEYRKTVQCCYQSGASVTARDHCRLRIFFSRGNTPCHMSRIVRGWLREDDSKFCSIWWTLPGNTISIQLSICWMRLNIWSGVLLPVNLRLFCGRHWSQHWHPQEKPCIFWQDAEVIN